MPVASLEHPRIAYRRLPAAVRGRLAALGAALILALDGGLAHAAPGAAESHANPLAADAAYNPEADRPEVVNPEAVDPETVNPEVDPAMPAAPPAAERGIRCDGETVCREQATGLPFQILPRSFSNLYRTRSADPEAVAEANVVPFTPLYVFAMEDVDLSVPAAARGWYWVARSRNGPAVGWMQAKDVLEWRQALVVAYTHPGTAGEGRQRVLMFEHKRDLLDLLEADDPISRAVAIYTDLEQGRVRDGLISKEPERFVDISRDFYLLPILDYELLDWDGDELRLLQLASALPERRGPDTLKDPTYLKESMRKHEEMMDESARGLSVDLVFVMDMTLSMQPYIDRTREAIAAIARRARSDSLAERFRFGLVGFRDDVELTPALAFTSKDFTPTLLDIAAFEELLRAQARAAETSTVGYAEEAFAGVDTALRVNWSPGALRFVVLVTDASSHPPGHPQNTTGKDARILKLEAEDQQIHVIALHLMDAGHPEDHELARQQYATLARVRGNREQAALVSVDTADKGGFQSAVEVIGGDIAETIARAQAGTLDDLPATPPAGVTERDDPARQARTAVGAVINAAMMEYLGRDVQAPKDIVVWTLDRDLTNPAITSLDVRVLLSKRQLSDLILALENVLAAMQRSSISNQQFFTALQEVAGQAMKDPDALLRASDLSETGMLPAYIASLPYHSEILCLSDAMFASMTAEQRAHLEADLRAKLRAYRDISIDVDGWKRLHADSADLDKVYPVRLDYLP